MIKIHLSPSHYLFFSFPLFLFCSPPALLVIVFPLFLAYHLITGDQTDAKVLLGTYVCTDTPGEFSWTPGVLTKAVRSGRWLLIEDIDSASTDVLSALLPLLERRELFVPGRGELIKANENFQLFATQTLRSNTSFSISSSLSLSLSLTLTLPLSLPLFLVLSFYVITHYWQISITQSPRTIGLEFVSNPSPLSRSSSFSLVAFSLFPMSFR